MIVSSPLELVFGDLFYRLAGFAGGNDIFLKLEGFSVTGSIKIKTAIGLIEDLEARGEATPGVTTIIESSSGNLGIALSLVCAAKGYRFICVTDPNVTHSNIKGMSLYGAEVVVVDEVDATGGYLGTRLKAIEQILQSEPDAVWLNQYANPANKNVHATKTAQEIIDEFETVDWMIVGSGTTGTIVGVAERLREEYPAIRIVAVEPEGSVTFGGKPGPRKIPGIGTSVKPKLSELVEPDRIITISERRTVETCISFARNHQLLVGGSTGSVLAATQDLAPEFCDGETIVAISPDLGEKYLDTIYDTDWVREAGLTARKTAVQA
ncbi:MAG: 2,3-diaminopropionate biosynthesis protein SbnA [Planctomycetes bacterium]|nr:2,3-diaminopropionate biosynthesis protein SbnA [Planctomycetota bacterium]